MAKDQTRNIETFKIGGTRVNEFEFHKHQGEMAEHSTRRARGTSADDKPPTQAERIAQLTERAHRKVVRRKKKAHRSVE
jgi:hypothetical protein